MPVGDAVLKRNELIKDRVGEAALEVNCVFKMIPCDAISEWNFAVEPAQRELAGKWE